MALDRQLIEIGQLVPVGSEHLDAVVLVGIVRRGDHHAAGEALGGSGVSQAGSGEDARCAGFRSGFPQAARESFRDPAAGFSGVLSDQNPRTSFRRREEIAQALADHEDSLEIEWRLAGHAANPVRAEEVFFSRPCSYGIRSHGSPSAFTMSFSSVGVISITSTEAGASTSLRLRVTIRSPGSVMEERSTGTEKSVTSACRTIQRGPRTRNSTRLGSAW